MLEDEVLSPDDISSLVSKSMVEDEELLKARAKEERKQCTMDQT